MTARSLEIFQARFALALAGHVLRQALSRSRQGSKQPLQRLAPTVPEAADGLPYVALAGAIALIVGDAQHPKQAIAYGMGWEAVAKGLAAAAAGTVAKVSPE